MNCTGHCCKRFYLKPGDSERLLHEPEKLKDGVQIRDMILPTGEEDYWRCKNYDPAASACMIYETRPAMCVEHPVVDKKCPYEGCTLSGEELKAHWATP